MGKWAVENDHQCSWPADKKGAFSFLLSRKGTSIQARHDSLRSLFITCFPLQLFRFLKIWRFFFLLCIFGHFMHVRFIRSPSFNNNSVSCSIQRYVKCMNRGESTSCLVTLPYESFCWIYLSTFSFVKFPMNIHRVHHAETHRCWFLDSGVWSHSLLFQSCHCCSSLPETKGAI